MRPDHEWFSLYGESHQNRTNKLIHYFCVPVILYSVLGLLDAISQAPFLNLAFSLTLPVLIGGGVFYLMLNWKLGLVTLTVCILMVGSFRFYTGAKPQLFIHLFLFIVAWILQFVGHKIEGKKPSFLQDLAFLLIGPLWIIDQWTGRRLRNSTSG